MSFDPVSRLLYATDASLYEEMPLGVARPRHKEDCAAIVRFAARHKIPLIPRAAGTSLAGQCVGSGLVVDVSRHMSAVLSVDPQARRVVVQPGVIRDDLNDLLARHGLLFGPETSTSDRCMIGGMIGNNACGTHSIIWGSTREHTLEVEAILSDGSTARFGPLSPEELAAKKSLRNLEGAIYRGATALVDRHRAEILARYPRAEISRRNTGYALDMLAMGQPWVPDGPAFNLCRLLCGSEGTLALTTEATLSLVQLPKKKLLICAHFDTLDAAMRGTILAVEHGPAAVELFDRRILEATTENIEQARNRFWLEGDPDAVLVIELFNDTDQGLQEAADALIAGLRRAGLGYAFPIVRPPLLSRVWDLRSAGLGLLMGVPGDVKAVTVIEDTAVAVADLPAYVARMGELMARYGTQCVYYAHASVGELHLRPEINLKTEAGMAQFRGIASDVADLVAEFGGSLSGEHGDGRLRAPFIERMLGPTVHRALGELKGIFDPDNILNPHKIVDPLPIDVDLRIDPSTPQPEIETIFDWSSDFGLVRAAEKCNGAGVCRRSPGRGTMCPSYMVTREEQHTTRGRANLFRKALMAPDPFEALASAELYEALDLCLSCKGCKSECPASVDMARMKAEFLQRHHDRHGVPLRARVLGEFAPLSRLGALTPGLSNALLNTPLGKKLLGVHPKRQIPPLARETFGAWARRHKPLGRGQRGKVVLFNDAFVHFNDPHVGIAAVELLEAAGFEVIVTQGLTSGRTQISKGLLRRARSVITQAIEGLFPFVDAGLPIVGLEPSAILTFRDEAPDLVQGPELVAMARAVGSAALLFEEFIARAHDAGQLGDLVFDNLARHIKVHGHCHQKALVGIEPTLKALSIIPNAQVSAIPSGCCGMAGSFGYEVEHYDLSMQIGELILLPAVRQSPEDTIWAASGTSCRHQIFDGTGRRSLHPAEILRAAVALPDPRRLT